ncbi:MAG: DUF2304 domain-containing protein [Erysipelotrichaceae bacterium]|nr:DUF2304 domain-containing protein [Erysipelotrichaceae bacterium]
MNIRLQIVLILVAIITTIIILRNIHKAQMEIKYTVIWMLWAFALILLVIFPQVLVPIAAFLGISTPINALFFISVFLSHIMIFYLYKKLSIHYEAIKNLNYEIAKLKQECDKHDDNK